MAISIDKIFEYMEKHVQHFQKISQKGDWIFTCPKSAQHKYQSSTPRALFIPGTDKIHCPICGFKGTIFDVVRELETDKKGKTDAEITEYLINTLDIEMYKELNNYFTYGWAMLPVGKNMKRPIETGWTTTEHRDKIKWIKWLNNGLNIGCRTGKISGITVIDIDNKNISEENSKIKEEFISLLKNSNTLVQTTRSGGKHFIFKYDGDIPTVVDLCELKIDTRNDGAQILVAPSVVDGGKYTWENLGEKIKEFTPEIKNRLLELCEQDSKKPKETSSSNPPTLKESDGVQKIKEGEGRNPLLVSLGGILVNKFDIKNTEYILKLISKNFFNPPLPDFEIQAMIKSLDKYKQSDDTSAEDAIYNYLRLMQTDVTAKDIVESLQIPRANIDACLSKLTKDGKAIRLARGRYKYRERIEWSDDFSRETGQRYEGFVPYFNELQDFEHGDIVLIGGKTSTGKTTTSLNIMRQVIQSGTKPYYIYSESGSRHFKIAKALGIEGKFYHSFHNNPLSIEIEPGAFTILDWLLVSEKEHSDTVFKFLAEEMQRKGGILVIMMQLKEDYSWFAPNMVMQFPALAARYILDSEDGKTGHFQLDKIRDSKIGSIRNFAIPCEFDFNTKLLTKKDLL